MAQMTEWVCTDPEHVQIREDGSLGEGNVCNDEVPFWKRCMACKRMMGDDVREFLATWGGEGGIQRRAELANAFVLERTTLRPRTMERVGRLGGSDIMAHFKQQWGFCASEYCDAALAKERWEIDHRTPITRGGENTYGNTQLLCARCNKDKGDKTQHEWENDLPARYDEWTNCAGCGKPIRATYRLCYTCKFGED